MALKTFVKINQVNNLSDARYCAGMGVGMLGFNMEPGTLHYINPEKFLELSEWVAGVQFAAEFQEANPATIARLLPEYPVDFIQHDKAEYLQDLQSLGLPLILRITLDAYSELEVVSRTLEDYADAVAFFLLQVSHQAKPDKVLISNILNLSNSYPLVLSQEYKASEINPLLSQYPLHGIALKGGEEIRAGYKDFEELADVLEALEVED